MTVSDRVQLDLAMRAGDRDCAANILQETGRLTVRIGENAPADQDTARYGCQAVALARAGLTIAENTVTAALAAKLHAVEGRGFALRRPRDPPRGAGGSAVL